MDYLLSLAAQTEVKATLQGVDEVNNNEVYEPSDHGSIFDLDEQFDDLDFETSDYIQSIETLGLES